MQHKAAQYNKIRNDVWQVLRARFLDPPTSWRNTESIFAYILQDLYHYYQNFPHHPETFLVRCLQHTATRYNTLQHAATRCDTLQRNTAQYNNNFPHHPQMFLVRCLQHTATRYTLQHTATHCNTLQHTATHCNTLQHTTTHCNTMQHITAQ